MIGWILSAFASFFSFVQFGSWSPTYTGNGSLTYTSTTTDYALWMKLGKWQVHLLRVTGTTGGVDDGSIQYSMPPGYTINTRNSAYVGAGGGWFYGMSSPANTAAIVVGLEASKVWVGRYDFGGISLGSGRGFQVMCVVELA